VVKAAKVVSQNAPGTGFTAFTTFFQNHHENVNVVAVSPAFLLLSYPRKSCGHFFVDKALPFDWLSTYSVRTQN
jgi:hypothetical protein